MIKSLVSFILIVLLFLASLGVVVYRLQDPRFVVSQARDVNLYGRLSANVSALIPADQTKAFGLSNQDVTDILTGAIDSEQFYGFANDALNSYLPWLSGRTSHLSFSYDLTTVKQKLADVATAKVLAKYGNLAQCTQPELRQWNFDSNLPSCQLPPGTLQARSINNQAHQAATKLIDNFPDTIISGTPLPSLVSLRDKIALAFKGIYGIWVVTILIILLLLLIYRSGALITLTISLLVVGVLQSAFSLVGWDWILRTLSDLITGSFGAKSVLPIIIDLISVILGAMKTTFGNISVGFLGTGVALLVLGIIMKIRQPKLIEVAK